MTVKIFYCYAHEDKKLRAELENHLGILKQQKLITGWSDRNINAGSEWEKEVDSNLNAANIILLLISTDFVNSEYCYSVEMKRALERHENGTAKVIPIILRHVDYEGALFSHLQALPTDAVPVTDRKWRKHDEAFLDVAKGIRKEVKELLCDQWLYEGNIHFYRQQYNEALAAFEQAIFHNSTNDLAFIGKGQVLNQLASYQDFLDDIDFYQRALEAFEQPIRLEPTNPHPYEGKGKALFAKEPSDKRDEILSAYKQAICFDPKNMVAYIGQGKALMQYSRYEYALAAFEQAIDIAPLPNQEAYEGKEEALYTLERYEESLAACEQTNQEFPDSSYTFEIKGHALYNLQRYQEALAAFEKAISLGRKSMVANFVKTQKPTEIIAPFLLFCCYFFSMGVVSAL